jgi:hypothetical protein
LAAVVGRAWRLLCFILFYFPSVSFFICKLIRQFLSSYFVDTLIIIIIIIIIIASLSALECTEFLPHKRFCTKMAEWD